MTRRFLHGAIVAMVMLTGCASVPNPFARMAPNYTKVPADALKAVAREVEQAVKAGNREPQIPDRDGVVLNTDLIRQSIRTRAARFERLNTLLDTGFAIEGRNGLISIVRAKDYKKATTGKERDRNALIVMSENTDRWSVYEGIVEASKFPPGALSAVQEVFHEARVDAMAPGQKYEDASGSVAAKGS